MTGKLNASTLLVEKDYMAGSSRTGVRGSGGLGVTNLLIVAIGSSLLSHTTDLFCACGCVQV